jgi:hypothetical protein
MMTDMTCPHCDEGNPATTHPIFGTPGWHSVAYEEGDYVGCLAQKSNVRNLHEGVDAITTFVRVHSFSSIDDPLSRDRPYTGQSHTHQGERGAQQVGPVTYRDIGDALHEAMTEMDANPYCTDRNDWDLTAVVQNALTRLERKTNGKNTD